MAASPENRRVVSALHPQLSTMLTYRSLPFRCWTWIWRTFRGASTTCRPPQNTSSTVRTQLTASLDPRNLELLNLHSLVLARHTTICSTDRFRICHLLHDSECLTTECRAFESSPFSGGYRQKWPSKPLLCSPQALESRKPYNGRHSEGGRRIHIDAYDYH